MGRAWGLEVGAGSRLPQTHPNKHTPLTSVGLTAILYDPISTNASLQVLRSAQIRQVALSNKAVGVRKFDRQFGTFAPKHLGGCAQRYLVAEHVVALVRELSFFLNCISVAGEMARARFSAAKCANGRKFANSVRDAIHKLAVCGLHNRDRGEEVILRVLDLWHRRDQR